MSEDLTQDFHSRLRQLNPYEEVNDLLLLEVAIRLGGADDGEVFYPSYRKLEDVSDEQLMLMIEGLYEMQINDKIDPGTSVGMIAAHSISEPITQSIMRTFHYAGILTKASPLVALNADVSMSGPPYMRLAIALKPPYNQDYELARSFAYRLGRQKLGAFVEIIPDHPAYREGNMIEEKQRLQDKMDNYSKPKYKKYTDAEFKKKKQSLEKIGIILTDKFSNEYTDEYQKLVDKKGKMYKQHVSAMLEAGSKNSVLFYLKEGSGITHGDLERCIDRQFKEGDGSFRTFGKPEDPLHLIFKNAKINSIKIEIEGKVREAVSLHFPGLPHRLFLNLVETIREAELCNNCNHPVTIPKMVAQNNKTKEEIIIEDSEWDTSAPIDSYYNKVAETLKMAGIKSNPPSEADSTGLIVISSEEFGVPGKGITFHTADKKEHKRCPNCNHGWINLYHDGFGEGKVKKDIVVGPRVKEFDDEDGNKRYTAPENYDSFALMDSDVFTRDEAPSAIFVDRAIQKVNKEGKPMVYPGYIGKDEQGDGISDYPLQHTGDGVMIATGAGGGNFDGEYFLIIAPSSLERLGDRTSGFIGQGGYLRAVKAFEREVGIMDFTRTTCNDVRQVENVLGIEAARTVLLHNLMESINDAGETHLKHAMLLTDAMCAHNTILTAPAGRGSVAGLNSQMGNQTVVKSDGSFEHYGSVLAQAYERQVEVLLKRSVQGMRDNLAHPKSAATVGMPWSAKVGTQSGVDSGIFSAADYAEVIDLYVRKEQGDSNAASELDGLLKGRSNTITIQNIKQHAESLLKQMDTMAFELVGRGWSTTAQNPETGIIDVGLWTIPPANYNPSIRIPHMEARDKVLENKEFSKLFAEYKIILEITEYLLEKIGIQ